MLGRWALRTTNRSNFTLRSLGSWSDTSIVTPPVAGDLSKYLPRRHARSPCLKFRSTWLTFHRARHTGISRFSRGAVSSDASARPLITLISNSLSRSSIITIIWCVWPVAAWRTFTSTNGWRNWSTPNWLERPPPPASSPCTTALIYTVTAATVSRHRRRIYT